MSDKYAILNLKAAKVLKFEGNDELQDAIREYKKRGIPYEVLKKYAVADNYVILERWE